MYINYERVASTMTTFGEELKQLRTSKRITQRVLAERIGVDFSYISKMENDKLVHSPSENIIRQIAEVLETNADDLIVLANKVPKQMQENIVSDDLVVDFLRVAPKMNHQHRTALREIIEDLNSDD